MSDDQTSQHSASSTPSTAEASFDFKSWQGLTEVLKVGKGTLSPSAYGEFRNLVLQYAQQGGDAMSKKRIDEIVAGFGKPPSLKSPLESKNQMMRPDTDTSSEIDTSSFSSLGRRGEPRFDAVVALPVSQDHATRSISLSDPTATDDTLGVTHGERTLLSKEHVEEQVKDLPRESEVDVQDIPVVIPDDFSFLPKELSDVDLSENEITQELHSAKVEPSQPGESEKELHTPVVDSTIVLPPLSIEDQRKRIAEIKRLVNEQYENPVALMGAPEGIGKQYMQALLSALKATSPGTTGSATGEMQELERLYKILLSYSTDIPVATQSSLVPSSDDRTPLMKEGDSSPIRVSPAVPVQTEVISFDDIDDDEVAVKVHVPLPINESIKVKSEDTQAISSDKEELVMEELPIRKEQIVGTEHANNGSVAEVTEPVTIPHESVVAEEEQTLHLVEESSKDSRVHAMQEAFQNTDEKISAVVSSVHRNTNQIDDGEGVVGYTEEARLVDATEEGSESRESDLDERFFHHNKWTKKEIARVHSAPALKEAGYNVDDTTVKQTELFAPHITAMLSNLLHEWSIFRGSGFFGTGPGGEEHPMYRTLAPLSMGEVLAGRWEGVDPKTVKIIKQYVDAWRHEQGVAYIESETFEHYLRRVVQRIMKRQQR